MKRPLITLGLLVMLAEAVPAMAADVTVVITYPGNKGPGWKQTIDVAGAVGPKHVVDFDEGGFVVHDKTTGKELQRFSPREFWREVEPANSLNPQTEANDPRILYDPLSERWFACAAGTTVADCFLAVSTSSDPTRAWKGTKLPLPPIDPYMKMGVDKHALYICSCNGDPDWQKGMNCYVIPKSDVIAPGGPVLTHGQSFTELKFALMPATDLDPNKPADAPGVLLVNEFSEGVCGKLYLYKITWSGLTATISAGQTIPLSKTYHTPTANNAVQPTPGPKLRGGGGNRRLESAFVHKGSVFGYNGAKRTANSRPGILWYEVRVSDGALLQEGFFDDPKCDYLHPSLAVDSRGNIGLGCTRTSETEFPSVYVMMHAATDPPNTMRPPILAVPGTTYYRYANVAAINLSHYSSTCIDPSNPELLWTYQAYGNSTADKQWCTAWAAFSLSSDLGQPRAAHDAAGQTNAMLPPLVDLGPGQTYHGQEGGLYPGGSNVRPAAHETAGQKIARGIVPLGAEGNPDPVNGQIVLMPVSVSNGYGAWHRGDETDTSTTFMTRANANPAKHPKLFIAYGFEYQLPGGNRGTGDPGPDSIFYKTLDHALKEQGVTSRQVQIVWLSMPVSGKSWGTNLPPEARTFPADAQQSKLAWKEIIHAIYTRYPNVKIIYSSTKGAMYMSATAAQNSEFIGGPIEPFNHDAAWGVKWVIEDQINGAPDLNYDPARGPVKAPWLSWGPYYWSYPDGTPRQHDGFVWSIADVAPDGLHPSLSGLTKYANMLLHQMTTDPTATPWFLKPGAPSNQPPKIVKEASADANPVSGATTALSVLGADDGGEPNLTYTWSCTGPAGVTFSANGPNRAKNTTATFPRAGRYTFQVTIADAGGLSATSGIVVSVTPR